MKNTPNTQDASSACDNPPPVPTARITATGPVAEKIKAIRPLASEELSQKATDKDPWRYSKRGIIPTASFEGPCFA